MPNLSEPGALRRLESNRLACAPSYEAGPDSVRVLCGTRAAARWPREGGDAAGL